MKSKLFLFFGIFPLLLLAGCEKEPAEPRKPEVPELEDGVIPVVFHVLYEDPNDRTQSPAASVFEKRIEQLNRFYAATLFPSAGSQSVKVRFALASRGPDGEALAEPGVHRVSYPGAANMSSDRFLDHKRTLSVRDKAMLWDPNRYVNVWLFGFLDSPDPTQDESGVTGVSYLPYCTSNNPLVLLQVWDGALGAEQPKYMHGIALNNRYFAPAAREADDEGMFTLCHEMGHYLGLHHAFLDSNKSQTCGDPNNDATDDGCSDTPKYDRVAYERAFYNHYYYGASMPYAGTVFDRQACDGRVFASTNVMDYFESHRTNLTSQQRDRIEHVLRYSPWIPRSKTATKSLLDNFTGEITDEQPEPILMRCSAGSLRHGQHGAAAQLR
jgi:zinc-dependent metalloproteinase lipoprotein